MAVTFRDNSDSVKAGLAAAVNAFLHEAGGEMVSQTVKNSRTDTGQTKGSYRYELTAGDGESTVLIGSSLENAIWEEFGTGEYALQGNGRKGYWVYVKGGSSRPGSGQTKSYTLAEAKRVVAFLRKKGLDAYYTKGKKPARPLYYAYEALREKIKGRLLTVLQEYLGG